MGCQVEEGIPIRITCRYIVRNVILSNHIIACINIKGVLKPKGMQMYRWCCCCLSLNSTKSMCYEDALKYGGRDTSESSLVLTLPKAGLAKMVSHYFH